ncbi:MAG: matrixin family metalloprotease [Bdellovibrionales bacterium]|jgi:hypothetical protein|nr:matrixin family metalloprotease [Bdellovibrionales bacterium]MBT3525560.1 matrixin family metalloprotease [Bdellovibrionales bacterium]MBT7767339.1 matrixin family metalloprotease [Bdellovibrionales bacterium]
MFFNFNKKRAREVVVAFFLCLLLGPDGVAFVRTRADVGTKISWPSWQTTIPLIIYLDGYHGLDSSSLQSSLVAAASQWSNDNHTQSLSLYLGSNRNDARIEQSDLLFTTNMNYFGGSGVLAVTQVAYEGHNGEIVAADIFINDNLSFKLGETPDDGRYNLESVITHEMGHMMGLGHGQVRSSTMYYQLFSGQDTLHSDDYVGMANGYASGTGNSLGMISGKVIGGDSLIGIFGTHIQVISGHSGQVIGGVFSDEDGSFLIKGLPLNDTYYLYLSPIGLLDSLPRYYSSRRMNFCSGDSDYRGAFYESCSVSRTGHPQGIRIDSSNRHVSIANITIGCDLKVPADLLSNRDESAIYTGLDLTASTLSQVGDSITGYFSNASQYDQVNVDLSGYSIPDSSYYLEVKAVAPSLFSRKVVNLSVISGVFDQLVLEDDLAIGYLNLDSATPSNNIFTIKVASSNTTPVPSDIYIGLEDDYIFYQLIVSVVTKVGAEYVPYSFRDYGVANENSGCPQAQIAYSVDGIVSSQPTARAPAAQESNSSGLLGLSCGTVTSDNDLTPPGSGPLSFMIGFAFPLLALALFWRLRQSLGLSLRQPAASVTLSGGRRT